MSVEVQNGEERDIIELERQRLSDALVATDAVPTVLAFYFPRRFRNMPTARAMLLKDEVLRSGINASLSFEFVAKSSGVEEPEVSRTATLVVEIPDEDVRIESAITKTHESPSEIFYGLEIPASPEAGEGYADKNFWVPVVDGKFENTVEWEAANRSREIFGNTYALF